MSYFDFPRISFTGSVTINVGTVNNDDYSAGGVTINSGTGTPGQGELLRLSDSLNVQAITYGMTDQEFITWCNTPLAVLNNNVTPVLPGEWNYYGDMGVTFNNVNVVGVNTQDGTLVTSSNPLIGTNLSFNNDAGRSTALICDVNPEDVPSSQIFADVMALRDAQGNDLITGAPSKAVTRWINFFRNANLTASAGASGVFQHVIPISDFSAPGVQYVLKNLGMNTSSLPANLAGFVVRYSIYQTIPPIAPSNYASVEEYNTALINLYNQAYPNNQNPGIGTVSGTIGLWYEGEMKSITMGRYLIPPVIPGAPTPPPLPVPTAFSTGPNKNNNGGGTMQLGPCVVKLYPSEGRITLDVTNTFPECYVAAGNNPKLNIAQYNNAAGIIIGYIPSGQSQVVEITEIDYSNTNSYLQQGGMIDLTGISSQTMAAIQTGTLMMGFTEKDGTLGATILTECEYMIASDQADIYAEQNQSGNQYRNDAPQTVNCCVNIYKYGEPIAQPVTLYIQEAQTTPNSSDKLTGNTQTVTVNPGQNNAVPLTFKVSSPGNLLYRVAINGLDTASGTPMPCNPIGNYGFLTLATDFYINLRVLPQDDFSTYIGANGKPTGTPVPWSFLYSNVLQYYNLIFPAMGQHVPFEEPVWQDLAATIYQRVDISNWSSVTCMPRTRDLSETRRQLIQAWCLQYMPAPASSTSSTQKA